MIQMSGNSPLGRSYAFGSAVSQGNSAKVLMDACGGYANAQGAVAVVADGMGGYAGGEVASRIAVDTVLNHYLDAGFEQAPLGIRSVIEQINYRIRDRQQANPEFDRMGTTVVIAVACGEDLVVGHVGDSRAGLYRGDYMMRLTKDHLSVVEREGADDAGVKSDPVFGSRANVLSRFLGGEPVEPDIRVERLLPGDRIVLASDGITEYVGELEINRVVQTMEPDVAAQEIVRLAVANRSHDHCSAAVLRLN